MPDPVIPPEVVNNELSNQIDKFYENYKGANDLRSEEDKAKDINQAEFVASATTIDWVKKRTNEFRSFPELNQFFTYECVAFTTAKLALINFWLKTREILKFSAKFIYDYRVNKPAAGMIGDDAFQIWKEKGIPIEAVCKNDQVLETDPIEISLFAKEVAKGFKLGDHITITEDGFNRVASTIQVTGKGVMVWFYFTAEEWSLEVPKVMTALTGPYDPNASRHSVTAVDFGIAREIATIDGQQVIKIEDSAHFGNKSVRYINREFFDKRCFLIKYPMQFNYENPPPVPTPNKPKYTFTKTLTKGMLNDPDVKALQDILRYEGFFPTNTASTGNYGSLTAGAVLNWQKAHNVAPVQELESLMGNSFGPKSINIANPIYA